MRVAWLAREVSSQIKVFERAHDFEQRPQWDRRDVEVSSAPVTHRENTVNLPSDFLQAVSDPGGGKLTLVMGAGCSYEAPTSIPLAGTSSQESYDRFVADQVLPSGDCATPSCSDPG